METQRHVSMYYVTEIHTCCKISLKSALEYIARVWLAFFKEVIKHVCWLKLNLQCEICINVMVITDLEDHSFNSKLHPSSGGYNIILSLL